MDIKKVQDVMKLQQKMNRKLTQHLEGLVEGQELSPDSLVKEKEKDIQSLRIGVDEAMKERDLAVGRWEQRIEQRKASMMKLEAEVAELKKQLVS